MAFWSSLPSVFLLVIVLCSISGNNVAGYGDAKQLLLLKRRQIPAWRDDAQPQISRTQNSATILEMKHIDHCSGSMSELDQRLGKCLVADDIRVKSIQSHIKSVLSSQTESSKTRIPITSGVKLQTLNYVVTVTLGGRNVTMIVDTGSELTWVQCLPCKLCYTQPEPLFNPMISPSYQSVLCNSQACKTLQLATGSSGICGYNAATCNYVVTYGDGSYTHGELGRDRLLLGSTVVDSYVFGCGRNNKGLFGAASGLIGLGRSDLSLVSQTSDLFGGVFSYCLPDTDAATSGSLMLGDDSSVYKNFTPVSYTRLVMNPMLDSFYILNLTGASVGEVSLEPPGFGKSGIFIDSGTVITRLPPSIYKAIKSEFLKQFSGYPLAPSFSILDTCFNLSAYEELNVPTIKMKFEGDSEMTVDVSGMFYFVKRDASQVCLALAGLAFEDEIGIIGNYQQRNTRVIYDTKQMKLGFAREICSYS
ncbi:protein ASPARTIC PROTEASE IN GUARD cell 2-like [Dorcoceras hygrometricum]|uniref:Protein ASPARTIC PROTEASE IN GUARD cell 2-like n=1 Tax=Dorcoceras hygrometricum TaxID=472368 RepID=A0A2Z7DFV9_9LAMI|nr:protein ASPARTIC PROTEASE IN GUARD cell 2-like [Dorcoceras hygrometricum]